jgi:hypothetical protein
VAIHNYFAPGKFVQPFRAAWGIEHHCAAALFVGFRCLVAPAALPGLPGSHILGISGAAV